MQCHFDIQHKNRLWKQISPCIWSASSQQEEGFDKTGGLLWFKKQLQHTCTPKCLQGILSLPIQATLHNVRKGKKCECNKAVVNGVCKYSRHLHVCFGNLCV